MSEYCSKCGQEVYGFYLKWKDETVEKAIKAHDGQPFESIEDAVDMANSERSGEYEILETGTHRVVTSGKTP